ncbi:MAG: sigma-70 family RNA polymerase sigma factor [Saprospiraceae bacterium]
MVRQHTDQQIIEAFRTGGINREMAWEFAYKTWRDKVIGVIINKGGTREEACEAMQDVAISFERRISQNNFVLQNQLATYFTACVYYHWMRNRKKAVKYEMRELTEPLILGFVQSIEADITQSDLAKILDETLSRIGDRCKVILLYFMNGYSMREIAELMNFAGGEQVAKNEKKKCQDRYENFLRKHPRILEHIQMLRNG